MKTILHTRWEDTNYIEDYEYLFEEDDFKEIYDNIITNIIYKDKLNNEIEEVRLYCKVSRKLVDIPFNYIDFIDGAQKYFEANLTNYIYHNLDDNNGKYERVEKLREAFKNKKLKLYELYKNKEKEQELKKAKDNLNKQIKETEEIEESKETK